MRRLPPSFDASLSAFREMTAELAEGGATRARVLARAERGVRRRNEVRRIAMPLGIALAILLSGAALTAAGSWRAPAAGGDRRRARRGTARAPGCRATSRRGSSPCFVAKTRRHRRIADGERLAYERAHRDHSSATRPPPRWPPGMRTSPPIRAGRSRPRRATTARSAWCGSRGSPLPPMRCARSRPGASTATAATRAACSSAGCRSGTRAFAQSRPASRGLSRARGRRC